MFAEPVQIVDTTSPVQSETPTPITAAIKQRSNTESYPENAQNDTVPTTSSGKVNPPTSLSIQGRPRPVPKKTNTGIGPDGLMMSAKSSK